MKLDHIHLLLQVGIHLLPMTYYILGKMPLVVLVGFYMVLFSIDAWRNLPDKPIIRKMWIRIKVWLNYSTEDDWEVFKELA